VNFSWIWFSYTYDASDHSHRPDAAVWPTSTEQIAAILRLANTQSSPRHPSGGRDGVWQEVQSR